jgi:L-fuconolactonase
VCWAPLEKGAAVAADLEQLSRHPILRGVRRIIQFEPDLDFCLQRNFIEGVRALAEFGLSFDICIDHRHMANALKFAAQVPEVPMMLDHIGKPAIKAGQLEPWASQMREFAALPHVSCKISGVATEADHRTWTVADLEPFIHTAIDSFGFDRVMFGGDWPVALQAISYRRWVELLADLLRHASPLDRRKFWHDNALRFYWLEPNR